MLIISGTFSPVALASDPLTKDMLGSIVMVMTLALAQEKPGTYFKEICGKEQILREGKFYFPFWATTSKDEGQETFLIFGEIDISLSVTRQSVYFFQ